MPENETIAGLGLEEYKYGFVTEDKPVFKARPGLDEEIVRQISAHKNEPEWMLNFRLKALKIFEAKPMPTWGGDLSRLDETLDEIGRASCRERGEVEEGAGAATEQT